MCKLFSFIAHKSLTLILKIFKVCLILIGLFFIFVLFDESIIKAYRLIKHEPCLNCQYDKSTNIHYTKDIDTGEISKQIDVNYNRVRCPTIKSFMERLVDKK